VAFETTDSVAVFVPVDAGANETVTGRVCPGARTPAPPPEVIANALASTPETTIEVEAAMADDPDEPALFVWATDGDLDDFEAGLRDQPGLGAVELLDDLEDRRLYRVDLGPDAPVSVYRSMVSVGAARLGTAGTHDGLRIRLRLPDRDALVEFRDRLVDGGVQVTVQRLYTEREGRVDEHDLTEKQRETVAAAVAAGYFEVPRKAKLADVADALDVSRQAASERLRRGMSKLAREAVADAGLDGSDAEADSG